MLTRELRKAPPLAQEDRVAKLVCYLVLELGCLPPHLGSPFGYHPLTGARGPKDVDDRPATCC